MPWMRRPCGFLFILLSLGSPGLASGEPGTANVRTAETSGGEKDQMTAAQNKAVVAQFFDYVSTGKAHDAFASLADDFRFELIAPAPYGGEYDREGLAKFFANVMAPVMARPFSTEVIGMIAEGDKVAVETRSNSENHVGFQYRNRYHTLIQLRNGKIIFMREYLDSAHLIDFLEQKKRPQGGSTGK
jgi:ketosteroid isomerase-like protein